MAAVARAVAMVVVVRLGLGLRRRRPDSSSRLSVSAALMAARAQDTRDGPSRSGQRAAAPPGRRAQRAARTSP
eukprot:scaffold103555_cov36-Phaeocystis_antarctica.AAC.2